MINEEAKQYWFVSHGQILAPMDEARVRCSVPPWCLQCGECRTLSFIHHVSQCTVNFPGQQTLMKPRHVDLWWPFRWTSVLTPGQARAGCLKEVWYFSGEGSLPTTPSPRGAGWWWSPLPCVKVEEEREGGGTGSLVHSVQHQREQVFLGAHRIFLVSLNSKNH